MYARTSNSSVLSSMGSGEAMVVVEKVAVAIPAGAAKDIRRDESYEDGWMDGQAVA